MTNPYILILGDICYTKDYEAQFSSSDPGALFNDVLPLMQEAGLCIANLEAPVIDKPSPIKKCGPVLSFSEMHIKLLKKAGIELLSLANNHILDHGEKGLENTLKVCRELDITTIGAGNNAEDISREYILESNSNKIAVLSYAEQEFNYLSKRGVGANIFNQSLAIEKIRTLKNSCKFILVLYHGGVEYYPYPSPALQQRCRAMVDAGADIIVCQHSHCIGTLENYKNSVILYGQGNTVFGYREKEENWNKGLVIKINVGMERLDIDYIPITAGKNGIRIMETTAAKKTVDEIRKKSELLKNPEELAKRWAEFCKKKKALYLSHILGRGRIFNKINRILSNWLVSLFYSKRKLLIIKNLLQCDSHREVLLKILEEETKD